MEINNNSTDGFMCFRKANLERDNEIVLSEEYGNQSKVSLLPGWAVVPPIPPKIQSSSLLTFYARSELLLLPHIDKAGQEVGPVF